MPERPDISAALRVAKALGEGREVTDAAFDALLPRKPRTRSASFWTPVGVAVLASEWFRQLGVKRLLDVGAGPGKLCSIASLRLGRRVFGIEQRPHLAATARELARSLGADVEIVEGTFDRVRAADFDAFYFYDPFIEQVAGVRGHYDGLVAFSDRRYLDDVKKVETWLAAARTGTAMIAYRAMGGRIPGSFKLEREQRVGDGLLRLWVKRAALASDFLVEIGETLQTGAELRALMARLKVTGEESPLLTGLVRGAPAPGRRASRRGRLRPSGPRR